MPWGWTQSGCLQFYQSYIVRCWCGTGAGNIWNNCQTREFKRCRYRRFDRLIWTIQFDFAVVDLARHDASKLNDKILCIAEFRRFWNQAVLDRHIISRQYLKNHRNNQWSSIHYRTIACAFSGKHCAVDHEKLSQWITVNSVVFPITTSLGWVMRKDKIGILATSP